MRIYSSIPHKHSPSSLLGCSRLVYCKDDVCRKESLKPEDKMKQVTVTALGSSFSDRLKHRKSVKERYRRSILLLSGCTVSAAPSGPPSALCSTTIQNSFLVCTTFYYFFSQYPYSLFVKNMSIFVYMSMLFRSISYLFNSIVYLFIFCYFYFKYSSFGCSGTQISPFVGHKRITDSAVSYEDIFISFHSLHLIHLSSLLSFHLVYLSSTVFSCPQPLLPLLLLPSSSVVGASPPAASTPSMTLQSELLFNYSRVNSIVSCFCVNVGVSVWRSL